ncbi:Cathepsin L [Giardia muris]|uniref:Cathepsin L n=1 Tax=Giardia muris TaxID=5742 RepID=A0A4Z1SVX5_GIAMU|nr:Cathepsin L [Giardia muris]|eukprot:TNJ30002.1 Cathepsin L [Giardia muris]
MFFYLVACVLGTVPEASSLYIPPKYHMKGRFDVVYGTLSEPLEIKTDKDTHRQVVTFYDGLTSDYINNHSMGHVYTQKDNLACMYAQFKAFKPPLTEIFPDLDMFTFIEELEEDGMTLYHYQYVTEGSGNITSDDASFSSIKRDQEDFYCLPLSTIDDKLFCSPRRWEMHGYNSWSGSHYDYYIIHYDFFDIEPSFTETDFAIPEVCNEEENAMENQTPILRLREVLAAFSRSNRDDTDLDNIRLDETHTFTVSRNKMRQPIESFMRIRGGYNLSGRKAREDDDPYYYEDIPEHTDEWYYNETLGEKVFFPKELDWRVRGIITPIKDQASCGSCWAFSTAGTIEGRLNIRRMRENSSQPLVRVSEQAIISCIWGLVQGCNGGLSYEATEALLKEYGGQIIPESDMRYLGVESLCDEKKFTSKYGRVNGIAKVKPLDIGALKYALLDGPVSVAVAVPESFVWYSGGVYNDPACKNSEEDLAHAVICVGWGTDMLYGDYWIIRNSWSNAWGVDGYMYLTMKDNICGVLTDADYAIIQ